MKPSTAGLSIAPAFNNDIMHAGPAERIVRNAIVLVGLGGALAVIVALGGKAHLHAPNLGLIAVQPWILQLHIGAAVSALAIGCVMLARPKGDALHKGLGWTWVLAMMTTALSTFFFPSVLRGHLSVIHGLSAWVAVGVPMAVVFVRRGDIRAHRRLMTSNFIGGLIIAGAFTFVPGRLMWQVFFG